MSNGESGSVLGTAIVGGSTATAGVLANTGTTSTIAIIAGASILTSVRSRSRVRLCRTTSCAIVRRKRV